MIRILQAVGQLFFIPHIILFFWSNSRELIIEDLYTIGQKFHTGFKFYNDLSFKLLTNRYFRTLFYFRTPCLYTNLLRIFFPKHDSFTIDFRTKLKGGLRLAHPYATIINAKTVGRNVYINQLVTIGEKNNERPVIGDNVEIHAHAIIIGNVVIGDNCVIGAGAVVVKDVPSNTVVVGNPAQPITK